MTIMKNKTTGIIQIVSMLAIVWGSLLFAPIFAQAAASSTPAVPNNLIANPQMLDSTLSSSTPDHWSPGGYNATTTYTYPVVGPLPGDIAAQLTISNVSAGASEWVFTSVPIVGDQTYAFSDWYNSDVDSYLIVQWTLSDGTFKYEPVATLSKTNGSWTKTPQEVFTAPSNATSMTMLHLLENPGTLTTSNYSLVNYTPSGQESLSEGIVSLTFDDGWSSQYDTAWPILKAANFPATFYIISNPNKSASYDFFTDTKNEAEIKTATTTLGTTWSTIYPDPTSVSYRFSDTYQSAGTSTLTISYTLASNATSSQEFPFEPTTGSARSNIVFVLPALATSSTITISHTSSVLLTASAPVLNEDSSGYLGSSQILDLQAEGNEIGDHTADHCNLQALDQNPNLATTITGQCVPALASSTTALQEITTAKDYLQSIGITNDQTFAYPYGDYDSNVETELATNSFQAARSVDIGYNTKQSDLFALKSESLDTTKLLSDVYSWIDYAKTNKVWLILVIHQVDSPATITSNGEDGGNF